MSTGQQKYLDDSYIIIIGDCSIEEYQLNIVKVKLEVIR